MLFEVALHPVPAIGAIVYDGNVHERFGDQELELFDKVCNVRRWNI